MNNKQLQKDMWVPEITEEIPFLQSPVKGLLVSTSIPCPGLTVQGFLKNGQGRERFFWQNGRDQITIAGFGIAVEMMAWGETRFTEIERKARSLFSNALYDQELNPFVRPRMFGGFSFRDDFTPDNTWSVFHPAHFFLPHFQIIQNGDQKWLTINAVVEDEDPITTREQLKEALQARYDHLISTSQRQSLTNKEKTGADYTLKFPMSFDTWQQNINEAVNRIRETELQKVVLARVCELRSNKRIDIDQALDYLNKHYQGCVRFLFEPRPNHAFYGATPELLAQVCGLNLNTMALAGSSKRGMNPNEDAYFAQQLLNSEKDRQEHRLVVDSIRRRLEPIVKKIAIDENPQIYTLSYIHHLQTPIKATLIEPLGALPLVEILHPTPALGGTPRQLALDFIQQAEPVPRGWYAAPIGWIDSNMDGEFAVAIRSAVAQERRVWLYSGAGIVANSVPENEWSETNLKFKPMFAALGQEIDDLESNIKIKLD